MLSLFIPMFITLLDSIPFFVWDEMSLDVIFFLAFYYVQKNVTFTVTCHWYHCIFVLTVTDIEEVHFVPAVHVWCPVLSSVGILPGADSDRAFIGTVLLHSPSCLSPVVFHYAMQHFPLAVLWVCFQNEFYLLLYSDQAFTVAWFTHSKAHRS